MVASDARHLYCNELWPIVTVAAVPCRWVWIFVRVVVAVCRETGARAVNLALGVVDWRPRCDRLTDKPVFAFVDGVPVSLATAVPAVMFVPGRHRTLLAPSAVPAPR